ncbi:MAG: dienelactone hydrolase family protein [Proteobacteria bacterium]|nr:dienelactone hydrolase family protein [Pseudomonadota bacterium]
MVSTLVTQTVVDYRRAIDFLETRPEIDSHRVAALGYSMGGHMVFILGAIEPRIKVAVASVVPETKGMQIEASTFASRLGHLPLLMLMADKDEFYTKEEAQGLYAAIPGKNKSITFYNSGHSLPGRYVEDAVKWIGDKL